jgi:hypothetical protein
MTPCDDCGHSTTADAYFVVSMFIDKASAALRCSAILVNCPRPVKERVERKCFAFEKSRQVRG